MTPRTLSTHYCIHQKNHHSSPFSRTFLPHVISKTLPAIKLVQPLESSWLKDIKSLQLWDINDTSETVKCELLHQKLSIHFEKHYPWFSPSKTHNFTSVLIMQRHWTISLLLECIKIFSVGETVASWPRINYPFIMRSSIILRDVRMTSR